MAVTEHDLPSWAIFDALDTEQRRELLEVMEPESRPAGSTVVEEGKPASSLWVLMQGRCEVTKAGADGSRVHLAELGPGAVIGEMTFFRPAKRSATVRCLTDVELLKLTGEAYARLAQVAPATAHAFTTAIAVVLSERLQRMGEWAARLHPDTPKSRHDEWSEFRTRLYDGWGF
jgi:CRP-like cAMP-binding protein